MDPDPSFNFNVNPDPSFHFTKDPDPSFRFNVEPDPSFHFNADLDPNTTFNLIRTRIRILLQIKVIRICENLSADPPRLHIKPPRLQ